MTAVWHGVIALTSVAMLAHSEPSLVVDSATELRGDPVTIRVVGAEPGAPITLTAERIYGRRDPSLRRAAATFEADAHGVVDVATMAPTAGSYRSVDRSGLFWSMRPTDTELPDWGTSTVIHISVDLDADGAADLRDTVTLRPSIDGLERIPIGDEHPAAFLMRPPSVERPPVVIVMGGSEGHDSTARSIAPKLASRGFAVVGLPYYSPAWGSQPQRIPGLPRAFHNIDLSRVESIRDWIRAQDDLDGERIGLWGVSKGGEMALAAASRIDGFSSVVAIVPSDVIWEGWGSGTTEGESSCFAWRGEPLTFVPYEGMSETFEKMGRGEPATIRTPHDEGRTTNPEAVKAARIRVELIDEPVLVVGGDADETWDSGGMSRNIKAARDAAGLETIAIIGPDAGHFLSGDGYTPGMGAAEARVQSKAFPAMLALFDRTLKRE